MNIKEQILNPRRSPFMALGKAGFVRIGTFILSIVLFVIVIRIFGYWASAVSGGFVWNIAGRPDYIDDPNMIMLSTALYFFFACIGALIALWLIQMWLRRRPFLDLFTSAPNINIMRIVGGIIIGLCVWSLTSFLEVSVGLNAIEEGQQRSAYYNSNSIFYFDQIILWAIAGLILLGSIIFAFSFTAFTEGFVPQNLSAHLRNKWSVIVLTSLFSTIFYNFLAWNWLTFSAVDLGSDLIFGIVLAAIVVTGRGLEYVIGLIIASSLFSQFIFSDENSLIQGLGVFNYDGSTDTLSSLCFSVLSSVLIGLIVFKIRPPISTKDFVEDIYD